MRIPLQRSITQAPSSTPLQGPSGAGGTPEAFGARLGESLAGFASKTIALGNFVQEQEDRKSRFDALRRFSDFQTQQSLLFTEAQRLSQPGTSVFFQSVGENYTRAEADFLASLPEDLREEFRVRTSEFGGRLSLSAMEHQYQQNDTFYKQGIQDAVDSARIELGQDGSKENLERYRSMVDETIEQSGLSTTEKEAVRRKAYQGLEAVAYRSAQIERLRDEASGIGTGADQAATMLQELSGMSEEQAAAAVVEAQTVLATQLPRDVLDSLPARVSGVLLAAAARNGGLSPEMVAAASEGDMGKLEDVLRNSGLETEGDLISNPEAGIDNDESFSNLPYEDRLALLEDAKREVAAEITEVQAAAKAQNESLVNALYVGLMEGSAGQADIDGLREAGILTDYDNIVKAQKILDDRTAEIKLAQLGQQMMEGKVTFAPGNEDHMKVLNAMIGEQGVAAIDSMDSEYAANTFIPIVRQSSMVPSDTRDLISGMIRSQDSEKMYWALDLMGQIERENPKAFLGFTEADRKSLALWQDRRSFYSEEEMAKIIRGPQDPAERNSRAMLRDEGEKLFAQSGELQNFNPVTLFTGAPGWFFGVPNGVNAPALWAEQQLNREFQTLFLDAYESTGNVEASKRIAQKELLEVWGPTQVGEDNVLVKWPPEKVYPTVAQSHDWLERQLRDEGLVQPDEGFKLLADTVTETEVGKTAPSYILVTKDANGVPKMALDELGRPLRVFFDFGAQEQMDENAWREQQLKALEISDFEGLVDRALKHSADTGVPIPGQVLEENMPGGIVDYFMNDDPAAMEEAEKQVRETMFGPPGGLQDLPNRFGTQYRNN
jgi:hypothetical protein